MGEGTWVETAVWRRSKTHKNDDLRGKMHICDYTHNLHYSLHQCMPNTCGKRNRPLPVLTTHTKNKKKFFFDTDPAKTRLFCSQPPLTLDTTITTTLPTTYPSTLCPRTTCPQRNCVETHPTSHTYLGGTPHENSNLDHTHLKNELRSNCSKRQKNKAIELSNTIPSTHNLLIHMTRGHNHYYYSQFIFLMCTLPYITQTLNVFYVSRLSRAKQLSPVDQLVHHAGPSATTGPPAVSCCHNKTITGILEKQISF